MELLQKYFPDQFVNGKLYTHKVDSEDEKYKILFLALHLINKNGLQKFSKTIVLTTGIIRANWNITQIISKIDIKDYNRMKKDLQTLKHVLEQNTIDINRIDFNVKNENGNGNVIESIVSKNAINTIMKHVNTEELKQEIEEQEMALNSNDWIYNKESFYLNFVKRTLFPLFELLKNETPLNTESNNQIYEFVHDIAVSSGVVWKEISTQADYKNYLKVAFNNIKKS